MLNIHQKMCGSYKFRLLLIIIACVILLKMSFHVTRHPSFQQYLNWNDNFNSLKKLDGNKILVTVYYEALCSDSRNFILKQLVPAYEKIPDLIELDLVPYGKATTIEENGTYKFTCQHSHIECEANKIHACALNQPLSKKIQLKYVACMIKDNMIPHEVGKKCAEELNIDYSPIEECASGHHGSVLLKDFGERTHAVYPKITFIPTIQLNGSSNTPLVRILKDLFKEICNTYGENLPKECL